jgi:hypothetical protein
MLGAGIGAATSLMGASAGQITPVVGGMLMAAGGAIAGTSILGIPVGAIPGAALMAAGGLMQMTNMLAQPALSHFGAQGDMYRRIGEARGIAARTLGAEYGFTPDQSIRYTGNLGKVGAYHGFGVMAKMRGGGFGPEEMSGFLTAATGAGAAGRRGQAEYERLGKILGVAFAKEGKLPSIAQAIDVMASLMGVSNQHLADMSDDQTKELTAWTAAWEAGPTAMMKGDRGVQKTAGLWGAIAGPQEPAMDMLLFNILNKVRPGMSQFEYTKMKESGLSAMTPIIDFLSKMPMEQAAPLLSILSKGTYNQTQSEAFLKGWKTTGGDYEKTRKMTDEEIAKQGLVLKGKAPTADAVQKTLALIDLKKVEISSQEKILKAYETFELGFTNITAKLVTNDGLIGTALNQMTIAVKKLEDALGGGKPEMLEAPRVMKREEGFERFVKVRTMTTAEILDSFKPAWDTLLNFLRTNSREVRSNK